MRARAPASAANLGPGFDALAVALSLYLEVSVEPADRLVVHATGCGADLPADGTHLAARVAAAVAGHDHLRIEVHSEIPVARGLGSSAALAVAAAAAAGATIEESFAHGVAIDGHPENAAASAFGGLVVATTLAGGPVHRRLALDPTLRFVVLVPDRPLPTTEARAALPKLVPHADAAFNLGRMGLLLAGLADRQELLPEAADDRLHQEARTALFPEAPAILAGLRDAGALTSCWSGAGSSLLAVCAGGTETAVASAAEGLLEGLRVDGQVHPLDADRLGVTVLRSSAQ